MHHSEVYTRCRLTISPTVAERSTPCGAAFPKPLGQRPTARVTEGLIEEGLPVWQTLPRRELQLGAVPQGADLQEELLSVSPAANPSFSLGLTHALPLELRCVPVFASDWRVM